MSAQHMVEHLVYVTKAGAKDYGPAPEQLSPAQLKFMAFVTSGAIFTYKPSDKKADELEPPRSESLEMAVSLVPEAISRIYKHNPDHIFYNPFFGVLTFAQMELLQAKHFEHHLEHQFGLTLPA